jgi:hypothetical protein
LAASVVVAWAVNGVGNFKWLPDRTAMSGGGRNSKQQQRGLQAVAVTAGSSSGVGSSSGNGEV